MNLNDSNELRELNHADLDNIGGGGEGLTCTVNGQSIHFGTDAKGTFVAINYPDGSSQVIRT
jgi:hypothetical protein